MRILLMGDARQVHLERWSRYLTDNNFDVFCVSLEPIRGIAPSKQIRIPTFLPQFLRYPMAVPSIRRIIARYRPHVINAHFLPNYGVIAALSADVPWVLSTWGSDIMMVPNKSAFHLWRTRQVIRSATCITSDADVMSRRLVELGADPARVVTFPFGVERDIFSPGNRPFDKDAPRILSNRKLETVYNVETVIAAMPLVREAIPGASLTVAGSGSLEKKLRAGHEKTIRFVGEVSHSKMPALLQDHDLFVSVSLSDTTSVSLLEAMACGMFPIVSDIPANREWIDHRSNGLLVPATDIDALATALVEACTDPTLRAAAAKRNHQIIQERADWQQNMGVVSDLFKKFQASK